MRKKTWIALVLTLALALGTLGMVFAGDFGTIGNRDGSLGGQPRLPSYEQPSYDVPFDELLASPVAFKFVSSTLWLLP